MSVVQNRVDRRRLLAGLGLAGLGLTSVIPSVTAQHSPFATPSAPSPTASPTDGPLTSLLAMVPLALVESQSQGAYWTFSDIARQFQSFGLTPTLNSPQVESEQFFDATYALAPTGNIFSFALDEELHSAVGFQAFGLDQVLYVGNPPNQLQLFRAPFDAAALIDAWQASGYEERVAATGESVWTIGPERELSIDHPIQRKVLSELNNLAVIDDLVVASPSLALVEQVLSHLATGGASLLDEPFTAPALATLPETVVSAMALPASSLALSPFDLEAIDAQADEIIAIRTELGEMPPIQGIVAGVNAGATIIDSDSSPDGTPVAAPRSDAGTAFWRLTTTSPEEAEQVRPITEARWNQLQSVVTGVPYAEIMGITDSITSDTVVEIDFRLLTNPMVWHRLIYQQDLLPLAPDES